MKLGFIGMGNMASAILGGVLKSGYLQPDSVWAYDTSAEKLNGIAGETGIHAAASTEALVNSVDVVLMAVKPDTVQAVLAGVGEQLRHKALVSIALGWPHDRYMHELGEGARVQFVMPNTPALVGEGVALFEATHSLSGAELEFVKGLFGSIGTVATLPSSLMNVGGSLSGCGPAFVYMMMEALADGAVLHGLPRDTAYALVSQMVVGAGKMLRDTGMHPGALKDAVCSPGGSTIRGVAALESGEMRAAFIEALSSAVNK